MKFSSKMEKCGLSPMRKFNGYADEAVKRGIKIYHLNIGQPDIKTPDAYFKAMREFSEPVLAYAPSAASFGSQGTPITSRRITPSAWAMTATIWLCS